MLARVLSAAVDGIEAFPVEAVVNCGWGEKPQLAKIKTSLEELA